MSLPGSAFMKLHRDFKPESFPLSVGGPLLFIVSMLALSACTTLSAGSRMPNDDATSIIDLPVVELDQTSSLANIMKQIDDARVVLVGETHTRYDHHLVQLEILKHLYQKSPNLALGVEWFQQPYQKHLDDYVAGEITEKEMLHLTDYFSRWKYNYRLYQPILQYARENNIPVIALNAPRELVKALARSDFDDLPEELKSQLPKSYDWSDKNYEKRLRDIFELHPEYNGKFENFMRSQLTWDESMAERAAQYLHDNPQARMLVLAGSGHIMFGSGIPNRIKRRIDAEQFSILVSEDFLPVSNDIADFMVLSTEQSLGPVGLIGAFLDTEGKLLTINGFSKNSAVKDAGLQQGTVIIGVDDEAVENFAEFKFSIINKKPGDTIELHYLDNAEAGKKDRKSVSIELR
jgi:uncharacterized iron-regulated protein